MLCKMFCRLMSMSLIISVLSGCSPQVKEQDQITIAVSTIGETHNWPKAVQYYAGQEVRKVAAENNWNYKIVVGEDANQQSDQIIELVNEGVDCIILLPMDGASLRTAAMSVQDAGIPLVIFDREIPDFTPTATVKGDNTGIGTMTADIFNGMFPDGTKVLELMGDTSTVPQQRTDGFDEKLHTNFVKEQVGFTGWQREDSRELFAQWAENHTQAEIDQVGAIFTHDDEIALGVLDALDAYQAENPVRKTFTRLKVIAASVGSQEMCRRIMEEDTYQLFSLTYQPSMISEAIRTGEKIIKGQEYEEMTIIPTTEINQENGKQFYTADSPY